VDLARAIADRWGVRVEIVGVGFDQLVDAVTAHRIDSAISALPIVPHRAKEVAFSMPYFEAGVVLATPLGSAIRQPAEGSNERSPEPSSRAQVEGRSRRRLAEVLAGLRVAVEWGSEGDAQARRLQRELNGNLTLVLRPSADAALAAAFAGEAEAVITDAVSLALFNRNGRKLTAVGEPLRSDPYVIVMPVAAPRLRQAVDEALAALAADGTLGDLAARWLGPTK
jgi:ABC-type amino acid transport substrate-binding protein